MKLKRFRVDTGIITPHGNKGIVVHDKDDETGEPRSRPNVASELIGPGAMVELDPNAEYTARWIRNGCISEPVAERGVIEVTDHTTADGLNDDFTKAELKAFMIEHADKFDDVPISSINKSEMIILIIERRKG